MGLKGPGQSLQEFKSMIVGFARPNRFAVLFQPPTGISFSTVTLTTGAIFGVKAAVIPPKTVNEIEVKHLGMNRKIAGSYNYEPIIITFRSDSAWQIRSALEGWMDELVEMDDDGKLTSGYHTGYGSGTMQILQMDVDNLPIAIYECKDVFPTNISEIQLDHDSMDAIEEFTVTFAVGWWKKNDFVGGFNALKQIKQKFGF